VSVPSTGPRETIFRESGLIALFLVTLVYVGVVFITPGSVVRIPLGLLELLFAPGYALCAILFIRRPLLPIAAEFSFSVGLSVVFNVLVGLILALTGPGLTATWLTVADAAAVSLGFVIKVVTGNDPKLTGVRAAVAREFRLPGIRPAYRPAAYAVLLAIVVAFGVVVYVSIAQPPTKAPTSLALYGADGTTATLPTSLSAGAVGLVVVSVANGAQNGSIELVLIATVVGQSYTNLTPVPWAPPLSLGPNTTSSLPLSVGYGHSTSITVTFEFAIAKDYAMAFSLHSASGGTLQDVTMGLVVVS
jgi:uncharacterized membrane protein